MRIAAKLRRETAGAAILEFAVALPLLVVFTVGIYDFGGAFNQKQKIEQAAQEGAIVAGAQPTTDLFSDGTPNTNPPSLLPVATAVANSLYASGVTSAICTPGTAGAGTGLVDLPRQELLQLIPLRRPQGHRQSRMGLFFRRTLRLGFSARGRHNGHGHFPLSLAVQQCDPALVSQCGLCCHH